MYYKYMCTVEVHAKGLSEIIEWRNPKNEKGQFLIAIQLDTLEWLLEGKSNCN